MSRATMKAFPNFDPEEDVKEIHGAIKMIGMDEDVVIDILTRRSCEQRMEIAEKYKASYGKILIQAFYNKKKSLADLFQSKFNGNFKDLMKLLLYNTHKVAAKCLYESISGLGTDELVILQILCTAKNEEIAAIKEEYQKVLVDKEVKDPSRNLEKDLDGDLSGAFGKFMIALVQGDREELTDQQIRQLLIEPAENVIDIAKVHKDVEDIYGAGAAKLGTDEATFIRIFGSRSNVHLCLLEKYYKQKTGVSLFDMIESETSGDFRRALKLVLKTCFDRVGAYAESLKETMAGLGTKDRALMQLILWRSEIDLQDVADQFFDQYGKTLESWIRDDTSGDYCRALLALMNVNGKTK